MKFPVIYFFLLISTISGFAQNSPFADSKDGYKVTPIPKEAFCIRLNEVYLDIEPLKELKGEYIGKDILDEDQWKATIKLPGQSGQVEGVVTRNSYLLNYNSVVYSMGSGLTEKDANMLYADLITLVKNCLDFDIRIEEKTKNGKTQTSIYQVFMGGMEILFPSIIISVELEEKDNYNVMLQIDSPVEN
jgi:hypothetical protein